jgi:hypothetical protein
MNRLTLLIAAGIIAIATLAPAANAQYNWGVNGTQAQLKSRINFGVRNGSLSRSEASNLQRKLNQISALESRFRNSGNRLSWNERTKLNSQLSRLRADIESQLSDFDRRNDNRRHRGWYR